MIHCSGDGSATAGPATRFRVGASYGASGADLLFNGSTAAAMVRTAVSASFDYQLNPTTTLSFGAGAGIGGSLTVGGIRYGIRPGWLATASYARRLVDGEGSLPFVILGLSFGGSGASTAVELDGRDESAPLYAFDFRAGLTVGKTFLDVLSPYAAARLFGGPVIWELGGKTALGTDQNHYQLAIGLVTALPRRFDVFVEGAPLGERAVTVGGGYSF
ncbi:MAG: hypothetical protein ABJE95_06915 [Byssovorax sp.]